MADEFYRQVTAEHFQKATTGAAQKTAQQGPETARTEPQAPEAPVQNPRDLQPLASGYQDMINQVLGAPGFEPGTEAL